MNRSSRLSGGVAASLIAFGVPGTAHASCGTELLAVAQIGFERIPGDQIARQMYEMRRSQAQSALAACEAAERARRKEAERLADEEQQRAIASYRAREQQRAISPMAQSPVQQKSADQIMADLREERLTKAVSRAVVEGRCKDAKYIALRQNRLEMADQATRVCEPAPQAKGAVAAAEFVMAAAGAAPKLVPLDRNGWVVPSDYPVAALNEGRSGRTLVAFDVSEEGFVENCAVVGSSGHSDLDQMACFALNVRGLFVPPRDRKGNPVRARSQDAINWIPPR